MAKLQQVLIIILLILAIIWLATDVLNIHVNLGK